MVYTYVIRSKKDKKWYSGTTIDLRKRFQDHNDNKVTSTKNRGPFELIYYEACIAMNDALARERYLKTGMGKRYLKNRTKRFLSLTGQALLELAIFGAILIMLLGILLNYGLRYSFQQKTMMSAFREALRESDNPDLGGQASVTVIQDKHIPNPSNPFAVGSVMPFSSGASVIRSYRLNETADTYAELPQTTIQIQDQKFTYKTAGFRDELNVPGLDKYKEVYGDSNVWETGNGDCIEWQTNPETGNQECATYATNIRVIDSCEGELMNYDACKRQCRMITQVDFCINQCERGKEPGSSTDCNAVCNQQMETPWYCSAGTLDNIFNFAIAKNKVKTMGLQPDYAKQTVMSNILRKQESGRTITTTDSINWSDTTTRTIVSIDKGTDTIQEVPVTTVVGETATQTRQSERQGQ